MRSKQRKIDWCDRDDLKAVINFADFMFLFFGPRAAFDLATEAENILSDEFCSDCERHNDDCGCNGTYRAEYDDGADYE